MCYADAVYTRGKVFTVDEDFTIATALAVRDGLVHAVGTDAEIETLIGPDTVVTDLGGRAVRRPSGPCPGSSVRNPPPRS